MNRCLLPAALITVLATVCCGGSDSPAPSAPSPPAPPAPPPQPVNNWSISGTIVDTVDRQPIAGARIEPAWALEAVHSAADGSFSLGAPANPPSTPYRLIISGSELVTREVWINWQQGSRTGIVLDVLRNRQPFSMDFYRQFVRGTYDSEGAPYPVLRWTVAPRFYVKTVDQNGRDIEPEVLVIVREALVRAVSEFTAGSLSVAALESGTEVRPEAPGWIRVNIERTGDRTVCGRAVLGANPGTITFYNDVCSCGSNKIPGPLVLHEVGHAMGFFHVADRNSIMYPYFPGACPAGQLSPAEKFHAAVAYSRPRGNRDPDVDPNTGPFLLPMQPVVITH